MRSCLLTYALLVSVCGGLASADDTKVTEAERLFALNVKPLLAAKCLACHGADPDEIQGELNLTTREDMLRGGETSRKVLVAGDAAASQLYIAATWENPDLQMPPKENDRLTSTQLRSLRDWINAGADWPSAKRIASIVESHAGEAEGVTVATSGGLSDAWTDRRYQPANLWAYQPLVMPAVPKEAPAAANPIDAFVVAKLRDLRLEPGELADRRTLLRRLTFDLTGLPPTPAEVDAFVNDPASDDDALDQVVDRLLASPHYGEQWGQHWLDVVRYADTSGFANDFERGSAWRYRDYVVRAFNDDKPYDQFIREQIAGDELDPDDPEMLIAVGFLRMGPWELTGMEVAKVARQRFLDDVTDSVGQVFLSHPLQCARCHDHKFDPIPTRDYYSVQAVFATTQFAERQAAFLEEENTGGFEERKYVDLRRSECHAILSRLNEKSIKAARQWYTDNDIDLTPFEKLLASGVKNYGQIRSRLQQQGVQDKHVPPRHAGFTPKDYGIERIARKGLQRSTWELQRYQPIAFSVYSGRTPKLARVTGPLSMPAHRLTQGELEATAILSGGDPFSPTVAVAPAALSMVSIGDDEAIPHDIEGRRTALANWIARPDNPLTARSFVNRVWQWHFGQPIAGNPNNFGATGKKPTHPRLLDWLAATFVAEGWSIKQLHRQIVSSKAYRRDSRHPDPDALAARDPSGTSYAVFTPRRLTAEELRDSSLAVSSELNQDVGGIPVRPEMNLEAALQPRMVMGSFATAWQPSPLPQQRHRRSIYALKIRGLRDPFMEVFNSPSPENSCEARDASTVTPQVFSLFNSQITYDRALALAARLKREADGPDEVIARAFELTYSREPSQRERTACIDHWQKMTERHEKLEFQPPTYPREVVRDAVEENTGEKFSFTETLHVYADFVPDLKPADVDANTRGLAELCLVLLNSNEFIYVY